MADEWLVRLLRLFGHQPPPEAARHTDLTTIDQRLGAVEGKLGEVDDRLVRLELLEHQADPRGILRGRDDG
jgi:hypothetical protein